MADGLVMTPRLGRPSAKVPGIRAAQKPRIETNIDPESPFLAGIASCASNCAKRASMKILEIAEDVAAVFKRTSHHIAVASTRQGYDVRTASPIRDRAAVIEMGAAVTGFVFILASIGSISADRWLWGLGHSSVAPTIGAIVFTAGIACLWAAYRGLSQSVRIDLYRREIHIAADSRVTGSRIIEAYAFHEVTGVFLAMPKVPDEPVRLLIRIGYRHEFFEVARGTKAEVDRLRQRLGKDLCARV